MGSILGDLPSYDPHNFSQLRLSDPSKTSKMKPITYHPTHDRTLPPPDQENWNEVFAREPSPLNAHWSKHDELRSKRAASESPTPEQARKHPRSSTSGLTSNVVRSTRV